MREHTTHGNNSAVLRNFRIDNFKSLVDFSLPPDLGQLTCLIGLNGSGKSTLLHAFDFIGHLVTGKVDDWLKRREWQKSDLTSRFLKKQLITFRLGFDFPQFGRVEWEGSFNVTLLRCTAETIRAGGREVLRIVEGELRVAMAKDGIAMETIFPLSGLVFQGSVLSFLNTSEYHTATHAVKEFASHLRSLDMLSPHLMRKRAKDADDVGYGGERLSAYLHGFSKRAKARLLTTLQDFYEQVEGWETSALRAGWKDLRVREHYLDAHGKPLETLARHLNDGMLRVLAILAQTQTGSKSIWNNKNDLEASEQQDYRCLLFDEIENGINPEIIEKLINHLLEAKQQIIVTSHSPMILNYLPDEVAHQSVVLLYRTSEGKSRAVRFFDLPEPKHKLQLLGPGEVFVDTDLVVAAQVAEEQRSAKQ
ncbi:MAG: AAA family ATPase [Pseudomonadota bacterium]